MSSPVVLLPGVIPEFFINGIPATGAKLFTYAAGTTTKQVTYTDSTGVTPQTNPILLNTRGEPSNGVTSVGLWLVLGSPYKLVLAPATDSDPPTNPIWTIDNVLPQGAGSPFFVVTNYGALGNGSHDDSANIQAAINAASLAGGGIVFFPAGNYIISMTLSVPTGVSLQGCCGAPAFGELSTVAVSKLTWSGSSGGTMMEPVDVWCGFMMGLLFEGEFIAGTALSLSSIGGSLFQNIYVQHTTVIAVDWHTDGVNVSSLNTWVNCFIHDNTGIGLQLSGGSASPVTVNTFVSCRFAGAGTSLRLLQYADTNNFYGGRIEGAGAGHYAVIINDPSGAGGVGSILFNGVTFDGGGATNLSYIAVPGAGQSNTVAKFDSCSITGFGIFNAAPAGAQVKVVDCPNFAAFPAYGGALGDYAFPATISVGASPFTYTNQDPFAETVYVSGGTVSQIAILRGSNTGTSKNTGLTSGAFVLQPSDELIITHTGAPNAFSLAVQ